MEQDVRVIYPEGLTVEDAGRQHIALVRQALGDEHGAYFADRMAQQRARRWRLRGRNGQVLVAAVGGHPVGAVFVHWGPADEDRVRAELPGVPLLYHFQVSPAHRRRGIGTRLLREAEALLRGRGHSRVALGVDESNKDARRLYERLGYEICLTGLRDAAGGAEHLAGEAYDILVADLHRP